MISMYFGPPGCGKSSVLTLIAQHELKLISKGKSKYKYVYTNFPCSGCEKIDFMETGQYYYHDALILLDELTLSADSRDYKTFPQSVKKFVTLHRHYHIDLIITVQDYSRCEKTVRENVVQLFYLSRFLRNWSIARPIYRTITINEMVGDLIMGYRFPSLTEALHYMRIWHISKARKYYNSFEKYGYDHNPEPDHSYKWS